MAYGQVVTDLEAIIDGSVEIDPERIALEAGINNDSPLVEIVARNGVARFFISPRKG